jgi:hypothetical protein
MKSALIPVTSLGFVISECGLSGRQAYFGSGHHPQPSHPTAKLTDPLFRGVLVRRLAASQSIPDSPSTYSCPSPPLKFPVGKRPFNAQKVQPPDVNGKTVWRYFRLGNLFEYTPRGTRVFEFPEK